MYRIKLTIEQKQSVKNGDIYYCMNNDLVLVGSTIPEPEIMKPLWKRVIIKLLNL